MNADKKNARPEEGRSQPDPRQMDREWLQNQGKDDLIDIILGLKKIVPSRTSKFTPDLAGVTFAEAVHETSRGKANARYTRLPAEAGRQHERMKDTPWRIQLIGTHIGHPPLLLAICGDVFIGRAAAGSRPDLDLTAYDAERNGMSRQHALLRPTQANLFLIDMGSTNGTYCNGGVVEHGIARRLRDNDTLSFGGLHFKLKIVAQPDAPRS